MTDAIAKSLAEGRRSGHKMQTYPGEPPDTRAAAFATQTAVSNQLGWRQIGWKVGCTSEQAQRSLKTDRPFAGPLYQERHFSTGDYVVTKSDNWRVIEPEILFKIGRKIEPRSAPYTVDEVLQAIESVHPAIEVVNPRLPRGFDDHPSWYIADGALNDAIIIGPSFSPMEREAYARIGAEATRNGERVGSGTGANVLGGPEIVLAWLANELSSFGRQLDAGSYVSTGVVTELFRADPGDRIVATFTALGTLAATF